jgi:hypothetical protein
LAIINDDVDLVFTLLELGADVHARATGRFFQPDDQQQSSTTLRVTNYKGEH